MFLDLNDLADGQTLDADVVIVGAGAAGITMARALIGSGLDVVLAESGHVDLHGDTQALCDGEIVGLPYEPLISARQRSFGGTTNMWSGWCKPLDPIDFRPRPWLGLKGWPIGFDDLRPYYGRALDVVEAGAYRFDRSLWSDIDAPLHDFDAARLGFTFWQKSPPTRFGQRYGGELQRATNVRVLFDANLIEIVEAPQARRVEHLRVRALGGRSARLCGRAYVLACGGIENARLLLASRSVRPAGVGNDHDLVGRCFMEHPHWDVATVHSDDPYRLIDSYFRREVEGRPHRIGWSLSDSAQERLEALNCVAELNIDSNLLSGPAAASYLWQRLRAGALPDDWQERARRVLGDLGGVAQSAWRKAVLGTYVNKPVKEITLMVTLDPLPNPSSRVTLSDRCDALGLPLPILDWHLSPEDEHSMEALTSRLAGELARLGLGRVRLHPEIGRKHSSWARAGRLRGHHIAAEAPEMDLSWHHMGTTRMASGPREGVVDADCRVHGSDNLFIAGSSVFPTTGNANPTLTIVALALRLSDHLQAQLHARPVLVEAVPA